MTASSRPPTRLLSRDDIAHRVSMADAVDAVEVVYRAHGEGRVEMPAKITLDIRRFGLNAWHNAMPGFVEPLGAAGIKWAGGYADNPTHHGLPYVMATIVLQDAPTGYPLAIMEGGLITNLRTGASAAVCAKYLARRPIDRVAFIGAGVQAACALEALSILVPPRSVAAFDIHPDAAERLAAVARASFGYPADVCGTAEEAVTGADLVVTATYADEPLVRGRWLAPGSLAISLGSYQEFDDDGVLGADKLVVDSWEQCAHRGELKRFAETGRLGSRDIHAEIGQIVAGGRPGRESDSERILAVPIGLGTLDLALAKVVYDRLAGSGMAVQSFSFL